MTGLRHNAADHDAMVHEHGRFTDTVGEAVIRVQDEAYKLGHTRAKAEAAALVAVVQEALDSFSVNFGASNIRARLQAAVAAVKGTAS